MSQLFLDFSLHGEEGSKPDKKQGLTDKQRKARYSKDHSGEAVEERIKEYTMSKIAPTHQVSSDWDDQIGKDQIPYPMGRLDSQPDYQEAPEAVIPFTTAKNQNKTPQKTKTKHHKKQK